PLCRFEPLRLCTSLANSLTGRIPSFGHRGQNQQHRGDEWPRASEGKMSHKKELQIGGKTLSLETGAIAKQANGACVIRYGDTVVLATACFKEGTVIGDFMPLTVDYKEYTYAGGRIPGGFFKREGRPTEKEILTSRLIDRPLRPSFQKGYRQETQIIALVLSADGENDPDVLAINAASAALFISEIPF